MKRFNLNEMVGFRLNDLGKDIYYHMHDDLNKRIVANGGKPLDRSYPEEDKNGISWFQLWHFMDIYGPHIGMGKPEFWKELNFYIPDEKLEDA